MKIKVQFDSTSCILLSIPTPVASAATRKPASYMSITLRLPNATAFDLTIHFTPSIPVAKPGFDFRDIMPPDADPEVLIELTYSEDVFCRLVGREFDLEEIEDCL